MNFICTCPCPRLVWGFDEGRAMRASRRQCRRLDGGGVQVAKRVGLFGAVPGCTGPRTGGAVSFCGGSRAVRFGPGVDPENYRPLFIADAGDDRSRLYGPEAALFCGRRDDAIQPYARARFGCGCPHRACARGNRYRVHGTEAGPGRIGGADFVGGGFSRFSSAAGQGGEDARIFSRLDAEGGVPESDRRRDHGCVEGDFGVDARGGDGDDRRCAGRCRREEVANAFA